MIPCLSAEPYLETYGRSTADFVSLCKALASMGAGALNLSWGHVSERDYWPGMAPTMAEALRDHGLAISFHLPMTTDISSVDETTRTRGVALQMRNIRAVGRYFPGAVCVIHPEPGNPLRLPDDGPRRLEMCRNSLRELAPAALEHGVRLALENMRSRPDNPNRTGMFTDQLAEIIAPLEARAVGICFDTGHAYISEGDDMYDAFVRNAPRIIHIHLADNHGIDDEHLMPGEGDIDFGRFLRIAGESDFAGLIHLEVKPLAGEEPLEYYDRGMEAYQRFSGV